MIGKSILVTIMALSWLFGGEGCKSQGSAAYGTVVTFSKGKVISFPDFDLEYTGETSSTSTFPNGNSFTFKYQEFKISKDGQSTVVKWTTGTGIIEPANFEFRSMKFSLELRNAEALKKKLDDDELVVTKLN
jgi:hypothetical protein